MKLLILDRDGVINHDSDAYIKTLEEWIPLPGAIAAIARLSKADWTVAVATNQSGLARGYYAQATLEAMHTRLRQLVAEQGGELGLIVHCPHGPADGWFGAAPLHEYNVGAACGGYWSGVKDAEGIPDSRMSDGTPNGYASARFAADGSYDLRWHVARGGDASMHLHAPQVLRAGAYPGTGVYANVYMGEPDSRVEYRVNGGDWQRMRLSDQPDPSGGLREEPGGTGRRTSSRCSAAATRSSVMAVRPRWASITARAADVVSRTGVASPMRSRTWRSRVASSPRSSWRIARRASGRAMIRRLTG